MIPLRKITRLRLLEIVSRVALFKPFSIEQRELFLDHAKCYQCKSGQFVQKEGEQNADFFLVLAGQVEVSKHGKSLGTIEAGQFIGESSFIHHRPKSASARATQDSIVLCMDKDSLKGLPIGVKDKFKDAIIDGMAERISYLNSRIEQLTK